MRDTEVKFVELSLALHPLDYANLQEAARAAKLQDTEFCALAIHREAEATLTRGRDSGSGRRSSLQFARAGKD